MDYLTLQLWWTTTRQLGLMSLPFLSGERFIFPSFVLCVTLGLLWCDSKTNGEYLTSWFNRKFLNDLFIHLCPNYWVNGCGVELKVSLRMVFLIENKIIFVLVWTTIVLVGLHQMRRCVSAYCIDGRLHFGRGVLV